MTTIVIPYRVEVHAGTELKYCLRSIEKYLTGWDMIYIIGEIMPAFRFGIGTINDGKLRDIEKRIVDQPARKEFNIYSKILAACELDEVSENFLMWHDDHYLNKPLNVSEIKHWYSGTLQDDLKRPSSARYRSDIQQTILLLNNVLGNKDFKNYDIHVPCIFNKSLFKMIFKDMNSEVCIKSYYAEMAGVKGEEMQDCQVDSQNASEIKEQIKDRLFFANKANLSQGTIDVLQELFPNPSKFEI